MTAGTIRYMATPSSMQNRGRLSRAQIERRSRIRRDFQRQTVDSHDAKTLSFLDRCGRAGTPNFAVNAHEPRRLEVLHRDRMLTQHLLAPGYDRATA